MKRLIKFLQKSSNFVEMGPNGSQKKIESEYWANGRIMSGGTSLVQSFFFEWPRFVIERRAEKAPFFLFMYFMVYFWFRYVVLTLPNTTMFS